MQVKHFMPLLSLHCQEYELTAISSSNSDKVTADWPDVEVVSSPEQLFANPEIELVIIPTPMTLIIHWQAKR